MGDPGATDIRPTKQEQQGITPTYIKIISPVNEEGKQIENPSKSCGTNKEKQPTTITYPVPSHCKRLMAPPQPRHDRAESAKAVQVPRATRKWPHSLQQANPQPAHTQRRHLQQKIPTTARTRDQQLEIQQTPLMRGR